MKEKSANKRYRIYFKDKFLGLAEIKNEVLLKGYKYFWKNLSTLQGIN